MHINILYESGVPIYEQIESQIRGQILSGVLKAKEALPSIRTLARELKVGIITAKRAYDDLCAEGFLYAVQGKGVFVASFDRSKAQGNALSEIKTRLCDIADFGERNLIDRKTISGLAKEIFGD